MYLQGHPPLFRPQLALCIVVKMPYLSDLTSALNKRGRSDSHTPQLPSTMTTTLFPAADNSSSAALLAPAPAAAATVSGNLRHDGRPKKLRGEGGQRAAFPWVICIYVNDREIASFLCTAWRARWALFPALFAPQTPPGCTRACGSCHPRCTADIKWLWILCDIVHYSHILNHSMA